MAAIVYVIPTVLSEGKTECLPKYILPAVEGCGALFVENERTSRRFLKLLSREIVIDNFRWHNIREINDGVVQNFRDELKKGSKIGIMSEAGCPGIADPGQQLIGLAQQAGAVVKPLVGPSSILLALMGSGMNGQEFCFHGYLPIDQQQRGKTIKALEAESKQKNRTQIFIETPYRNNQLLESLLKNCNSSTQICIAVDLTADAESIKTRTVQQWQKSIPELHKRPAIFLLYAGNTDLT